MQRSTKYKNGKKKKLINYYGNEMKVFLFTQEGYAPYPPEREEKIEGK